MLPQKPYCYISYDSQTDGARAVEALNGYKLLPTQHRKHEVILYTLFVSSGMCISNLLKFQIVDDFDIIHAITRLKLKKMWRFSLFHFHHSFLGIKGLFILQTQFIC